MKITLGAPAALHEKGNRQLNEDFIFPPVGKADAQTPFFIVCDGMGGEGKGNVASQMVATHIANYLNALPTGTEPNEGQLKQALRSAEAALSTYIETYPNSAGMGTTLSLAFIGPTGITLAWAGNSPIIYFQASQGQLIYVNKEQMQGGHDPQTMPETIHGKESPATLHVKKLPPEMISAGDYLFLATDGTMEQANERTLSAIFPVAKSAGQLVEEIAKFSDGTTQDNYSCYMVKIDSVEGQTSSEPTPVQQTTGTGETSGSYTTGAPLPETQIVGGLDIPLYRRWPVLAGAGAVVLLATLAILFWPRKSPYKSFERYQAEIEAHINAEQGTRALSVIDSARFVVSGDARKDLELNRLERRAQEVMRLNAMSPEELTQEGYNFMANRDYDQAAEMFEKARAKAETSGTTLPDSVMDDLVFSHIKIASAHIDGENADPEKTLTHLRSAVSLGEGRKIADTPYFKEAERTLSGLETQEDPAIASRSVPGRSTEPSSSVSSLNALEPSATSASRLSRSSDQGNTVTRTSSNSSALSRGKQLFDKAKSSQSNYEYQKAAEYLEEAGGALDGKGAYLLAHLYNSGKGVERDPVKALQYAQRSAQLGWPSGHYLYAHLLLLRENRIDTLTAVSSLRKAAETSHIEAMNRLKQLGIRVF